MAAPDPELLAGARLLSTGAWRAAHEAFEVAWRRSEGDPRQLLHALAQLAAALLKWSQGRREATATLLGRVRGRLEGLPSRVSEVEVDTLESTVQDLQERLALGDPAPGGLELAVGAEQHAPADRLELGATCPYCGEQVDVEVDPTGMSLEQYTEDCPVCCRPWVVQVERGPSGPTLSLAREDD